MYVEGLWASLPVITLWYTLYSFFTLIFQMFYLILRQPKSCAKVWKCTWFSLSIVALEHQPLLLPCAVTTRVTMLWWVVGGSVHGDSLSLALQELMLPARQLLYFHTDPPLLRCVLGGRREKWQQKNFLFLSLRLSMQYTFSFLEQNASDSVKTEIGIQKTIRENLQLDLQTFYRFLGLRFSY